MEPVVKNTMTPLEKLKAEKQEARQRCEAVSLRLNENLSYMQQHTGEVLLSGVRSLLFSGPKTDEADPSPFDYLSLGKIIIPHLWSISKPFLITWGIAKIQSVLLHKITGKRMKK